MSTSKYIVFVLLVLYLGPDARAEVSLHSYDICESKNPVREMISIPEVPDTAGFHDVGNIELLIDDTGGGFLGWRYTHKWPKALNVDHLFWNWLAVGYSNANVSDGWDDNWRPLQNGNLIIVEPGTVADEQGWAHFSDPSNGIAVIQDSYAWATHPNDDYVILKYTIINISNTNFVTLYAGHRSDFDVLGDHNSAITDMCAFDEYRCLGYMYDIHSTWHVGVKLLEGVFRGYHTGWYSGSEYLKYTALSMAGIEPPTPSPDDYCIWVTTGPYVMLPNDSVVVAFAFLAGENLLDLQDNSDAAQMKYNSLAVQEQVDGPQLLGLTVSVHPNPFRDVTTIEFKLHKRCNATITIHDITGAEIQSLSTGQKSSGVHRVAWHGSDYSGKAVPSGVYFLRFKTDDFTSTKKVVLLR